jgi:hypothetical protein
MYALRDYMGEEALNERIRAFLDRWKYRGPPYPTSLDLLAHIEPAVPAEHHGLIDDFFRTITLWDLRASDAVAEETGDGRWRVAFTIEATKQRASPDGTLEEVPMADHVDVACSASAARATRPRVPSCCSRSGPSQRDPPRGAGGGPAAGASRHRPVQQAHRPQPRGQPDPGALRVARAPGRPGRPSG